MRRSISTQYRFDCDPVSGVQLNLDCRDEIVPILAALQHIYADTTLRDQILHLIGQDVNRDTSIESGREGMEYWHILVLAAVRLGCNFNYDRLQDLAENHRRLRHIMGIGDWQSDITFNWRTIRNNICLLSVETISKISQLIVGEGHKLAPDAATKCRADSFVVETNIHYPTESSLIFDGIRKVIELSVALATTMGLPGWRQSEHMLRKVKNLAREIGRVSRSKKPTAKDQMRKLYSKLLKRAERILNRAEMTANQATSGLHDNVVDTATIRVFIERTRHVAGTAYRRVILGEVIPNEEKLFSIFEPHTQLYRRGKAATPNQFGRLVMIYEDAVGFVVHHYLFPRDATDAEVAVPQTRVVQSLLANRIEELSFDRGFYTPENEKELSTIVTHPCLPKRHEREYNEQQRTASVTFRRARQRHPGVESAIGALQNGNGMQRCRDRTEVGFERYLALAILGRNLHVLGKLLIHQRAPHSLAAISNRKVAA
jgi:IS5 family transposase